MLSVPLRNFPTFVDRLRTYAMAPSKTPRKIYSASIFGIRLQSDFNKLSLCLQMPLRCLSDASSSQMPPRCLSDASQKPLRSLSDASQMSPQRDMPLRCLPDASSMRYASQMPLICLLNEICLSDASQKPLRCFSYAFSMSFRNMKCMILGTRATCIYIYICVCVYIQRERDVHNYMHMESHIL